MIEDGLECDVLVAGGGVAGVAAAVEAAREGARTVLVEKENLLGGTGYYGLLHQLGGLYLNGEEDPEETLNEGIVREVVERLKDLAPERNVEKVGQVYVLPYRNEDLRAVFESMCKDEPGLMVMNNASVMSVKRAGDKVAEVEVRESGEIERIFPQAVIDCTGDGVVAALAGADTETAPPEKIQMAGFVVKLKGLKDVDDTLSVKVPYYLSRAVDEGVMPLNMKFTMFSAGDIEDEGFCKMSVYGDEEGGRDQKAREAVESMVDFLSEKIPAFSGAYIYDTSLHVMDREGRRVCGEYVLTEEDVLKGRKFTDGIVKNSWPVEIWDRNKGTVYKYLEAGEYYEIPFRCIKVKGLENMLCAGRCISASSEALASTRVMGTCMSLGEQAGLAAAGYAIEGKYPF